MSSTELLNCDKRGAEFTLYYNTGSCDTPVWVKHLGITGDLTINDTDDEEELAIRDPDQYIKFYVSGKADVSITGEQAVDPEYEGYSFLNAMRGSGDPGDVLILTGDLSEVGSVGWRGHWRNFDRTLNGPNTGAATQAFSLKPAACVECPVRPVLVDTEGSIEDYDPGEFVPAPPAPAPAPSPTP